MKAYIKDKYSRLYTVMILNFDEGHVILDVDGEDIDDKYDIDDVIFVYYFNE